jgi:hypothetical protein
VVSGGWNAHRYVVVAAADVVYVVDAVNVVWSCGYTTRL